MVPVGVFCSFVSFLKVLLGRYFCPNSFNSIPSHGALSKILTSGLDMQIPKPTPLSLAVASRVGYVANVAVYDFSFGVIALICPACYVGYVDCLSDVEACQAEAGPHTAWAAEYVGDSLWFYSTAFLWCGHSHFPYLHSRRNTPFLL